VNCSIWGTIRGGNAGSFGHKLKFSAVPEREDLDVEPRRVELRGNIPGQSPQRIPRLHRVENDVADRHGHTGRAGVASLHLERVRPHGLHFRTHEWDAFLDMRRTLP
jgi:hypothetical protein